MLDVLALSYNTNVHTATGFSPVYLLRGFHPLTGTRLRNPKPGIPRPGKLEGTLREDSQHTDVLKMVKGFEAERCLAQDVLLMGQVFQQKYYNKGRKDWEFEEGDWVVLNQNTLGILEREKGNGKKFLACYDGPFKISEKISPVVYRIHLPASYGMHPILNIAHLEKYIPSPEEFGNRPRLQMK